MARSNFCSLDTNRIINIASTALRLPPHVIEDIGIIRKSLNPDLFLGKTESENDAAATTEESMTWVYRLVFNLCTVLHYM